MFALKKKHTQLCIPAAWIRFYAKILLSYWGAVESVVSHYGEWATNQLVAGGWTELQSLRSPKMNMEAESL